MSPEKKIRMQARSTLGNNNWPKAVAAMLVVLGSFLAVLYIVSGLDTLATTLADPILESIALLDDISEETTYAGTVSSFLIVPMTVLLVPLVMGLLRFFYRMTKNQDLEFSELFYYSGKKFFRSLGVFFGILLRCLWQAVVCFLPSYIGLTALTISTAEKDNLAFSDNLWYFIVYALLFGGILVFCRLTARYFLSLFLYFEDENLSVKELCTLSSDYMQKFRSSVMKLILSLFPWMLSCILIFPCLFVLPYVFTCLSTSAKWIIALYYQSEIKDE